MRLLPLLLVPGVFIACIGDPGPGGESSTTSTSSTTGGPAGSSDPGTGSTASSSTGGATSNPTASSTATTGSTTTTTTSSSGDGASSAVSFAISSSGGTRLERFTSGSRLKTRTLVGSDGARMQLGFHDNQLDVDCVFHETTSGARCMPATTGDVYTVRLAKTVGATTVSDTVFTESTCTTPGAVLPSWLANTPFLLVFETGSDTPFPRYAAAYRVGSILTQSEFWVRNNFNQCLQGTVSANQVVVSRGAEVPLTDFISATDQLDP